MKALFFSDIDGTLLDHDNYCYDESMEGLALLKKKEIPLVLVSSKTFDEISVFVKELDIDYPFAFENGSGIAYPSEKKEKYVLDLEGPGVQVIEGFIAELEVISGMALRGITSLTEREICEITGLNPESAAMAKKRKTTLPFLAEGGGLLSDAEISDINAVLEEHNLKVTKGGRFNHLLPLGSGKGEAVKKIIEFYRAKFNDEIISAAAGDSTNDMPMLESVDYSYVVRKPDGSYMDFMAGKIMNSSGPAGFSEAVKNFLNIIAG